MARYRVLEKSFINNSVVEAGAEVECDGEPSSNLELIDGPKKKPTAKKADPAGDPAADPVEE